MIGKMQDWPLTVNKVIEHAKINYPRQRVVTRTVEGPIVETNYSEIHDRAKQVSNALKADGIQLEDRVATLAWNTARHMETWFGAMGIGSVLHTINPRLHPDQIAWIANDAEDKVLFVDLTFVPLLEAVKDKFETVKRFVIYCDAAHLPETTLENVVAYEDYIAGQSLDCTWGDFPETTACGLCYTSGTTGNPKGVLYSHRSNVLHTLMTGMTDALGISIHDRVLPVVPMFHANAWGLTFTCPAVGAEMILPGAKMDGESIYEMLDTYQVTTSAAVPTVWLMLLQHLEANDLKLPALDRVVIGGSAVPERILRTFQEKYGVEVGHAWGMTETSPLGTIGSLTPEQMKQDYEHQIASKLKQGRPPFGVEMKITDDDGNDLPRDGKTSGHLLVRGMAIVDTYYKGAGGDGGTVLDEDDWFDTGDVANIDDQGFMQITDRAKDVIKSGGEWISSIDIENFAVGHPKVANAAAIGIYHPKWDERPLLIIQLNEGETATKEDILKQLEGKIAKWWTPDDVAFVDAIPLGATGKINKLALRDMFKDYTLPTA
ncbi:MAG: long-chain fatty acid--CoA ligase [Ponticaulis sp.]|nr:long-chain fatty acid--CoA ligase [Ponticaulis sp.]